MFVQRHRVAGDRAAVQIFPLREGKMIDRYGFHLENVGGQDLTTARGDALYERARRSRRRT